MLPQVFGPKERRPEAATRLLERELLEREMERWGKLARERIFDRFESHPAVVAGRARSEHNRRGRDKPGDDPAEMAGRPIRPGTAVA